MTGEEPETTAPPPNLPRQNKYYMAIVAFVNISFVVNGILFPLAIMNIIIVGLPHFRDLGYMVMRIIFSRCKFVRWSAESADEEEMERANSTQLPSPNCRCQRRSCCRCFPRHHTIAQSPQIQREKNIDTRKSNVVAVIPAYKEDPEEVELTLTSIGEQLDEGMRICQMIVSDGFLDYHEIIEELHEIVSFPYTTYKRQPNRCAILVGYYKGQKVCVAKKRNNAGKKDSLVVTDDILIKAAADPDDAHFRPILEIILKEFGMETCDYIFHTDADSVIGPHAFRRMINALESNPKIAAVAGLVLVPFTGWKETGFWNLFQGFQYYYGQVIRKATESLWGKVTCLPGCITMVRAQHSAVVQACDRYNKLPSNNFIFQIKNRLQGTDRRYTNCVTQYSADTYLVVDMHSDCFTVPPQSMEHFRSQRKRWTSNAITGNWFLMLGSNVPLHTRILCGIDIFRIHTSVTRFCCTVQFFLALGLEGAVVTTFQIVMLIAVIVLPYLFFLSTIVSRGRYGLFLLAGSVISKICSPFITVYIFMYAISNFADLTWGKTHGSQPTAAGTAKGDEPENDLHMGIIYSGDYKENIPASISSKHEAEEEEEENTVDSDGVELLISGCHGTLENDDDSVCYWQPERFLV